LFSIEIATATMTACLIISAAFQILALRRLFYLGRGQLNRLIVFLMFSAGGAFQLAHTTQIDLRVAFGVSIVPSLCLFPSCMNISARILPELTPLGIMEIIITAKNFIFYSGDRATPDPHASLSPVYSCSPQPPPVSKAVASLKNRRASGIKPDLTGTVQ
jgi:hypothetical protein